MKKKVSILRAEESEQVLNMLKDYLNPEGLNRVFFSKEELEDGDMCREVSFRMCVSKKAFKQLKKFTESVDIVKAVEDDFCEETLDDRVDEALKKCLEESGAVQCVVIKHDGEAR